MEQQSVILFMKGTPSAPYDGYQAEGVEILNRDRIRYGYFDVLKDKV